MQIEHENDLYFIKPNRVCITLVFIVNRPLNGVHVFHKISVDIVPSLHIDGYWPDDAMLDVSENLKSDGCHLVFDQPHKLQPWIYSGAIPYARISFSRAESRIIRNGPPVDKAVFMITKYLMNYLVDGAPTITTQTLKTALLHCLAAEARHKTKHTHHWSRNYDSVTHQELHTCVIRLFLCVLQFCHRDLVPSYNFPSLCLPPFCRENCVSENHMKFFLIGLNQPRDSALLLGRLTVDVLSGMFEKNNRYSLTPLKHVIQDHIYVHMSLLKLFWPGTQLGLASLFPHTNPLCKSFHRICLINNIYNYDKQKVIEVRRPIKSLLSSD